MPNDQQDRSARERELVEKWKKFHHQLSPLIKHALQDEVDPRIIASWLAVAQLALLNRESSPVDRFVVLVEIVRDLINAMEGYDAVNIAQGAGPQDPIM